MEGENHVKGLPEVSAVNNTVKNVNDNPMEGDNYIKNYLPGINTVPNSDKVNDTTDWSESCGNNFYSVHDKTDWLDSCTQNNTSSFGFLFAIFVLSCIMIIVNYINIIIISITYVFMI